MAEPVVFIPGLQSDYRSWVWQLRYFAGRRECIVPAGHYACPTIDEMSEVVFQQFPERFHLVAWSMGGYVALPLLPRLGDRLLSLVFIATSAASDEPANAVARRANVALAEREGMRTAQRASLAISCADPAIIDTAEVNGILDASEELGVELYRSQQEAIIARRDRSDLLPEVRCPTLVIVGDKDRVTPPRHARQIAHAISGAQLHVIPGCGHCPPFERPDLVNGLLDAWFTAAEANDVVVRFRDVV
jgi:pimeloyl-ACP methyl ester carboxylesterase